MAEDVAEIRRQKSTELRIRAEMAGSEEPVSIGLSRPIQVNGDAELSKTIGEYDLVLTGFCAD